MAQKRGNKVAVTLYFFLLAILLLLLVLYVFNIYPMQTDFFARYLLALVFVLLLLPLVPSIKVFDIIDLRRQTKMFRATAARKKK